MGAVEACFRAYGPATPDHVHYWLGCALSVATGRPGGVVAMGERCQTFRARSLGESCPLHRDLAPNGLMSLGAASGPCTVPWALWESMVR